MKYRRLGKTELSVSEISFGAWQLGNRTDWKGSDEQAGIQLVHHALSSGCTLFDTAPAYAGGESERILGQALRGNRQDVVICTKFGHLPDAESDYSADRVSQSLNRSLSSLQTDYVDILLMHSPPLDEIGRHDTFDLLERLKGEGKIRAYGVSVDTSTEIERVMDSTRSEVVEVMFNLLYQEPLTVFSSASEQGIGILVKVPLDSGWLSGKYNADSQFTGIRSRWTAEQIKRRAALVAKLQTLVSPGSLSQTAIQFILKIDTISSVIPGVLNIQQFDQHINAAEQNLDAKPFEALKSFWAEEMAETPLGW